MTELRKKRRWKYRVPENIRIVKRKLVTVDLKEWARKRSRSTHPGSSRARVAYLPTPGSTGSSTKRRASASGSALQTEDSLKHPDQQATPSEDQPDVCSCRGQDLEKSFKNDELAAFQIDGCGDTRLSNLSQLPLPPLYERKGGDIALGRETPSSGFWQDTSATKFQPLSQATQQSDITEEYSDNDGADSYFDSFSGDRFSVPAASSIFERQHFKAEPKYANTACLKLNLEDITVPAGAQRFYAVIKGRKPGVYFEHDWEDQVNGYPNSYYKRFDHLEHAVALYNASVADCSCSICVNGVKIATDSTAGQAVVELCEEQQELVKLILEGHNVFYTGAAGTGKSFVLRHFVKELEKTKTVAKVAPTGLSAQNMPGRTYYSWAGWTLHSKKKGMRKLVSEATSGLRWHRLNATDVLVIDEVSMIEAHQFERLDRVCRAARGLTKDAKRNRLYHNDSARSKHDERLPFGGMQVIVTGDFRQLPAVRPFSNCIACGRTFGRNNPPRCIKCDQDYTQLHPYAFCGRAWKLCNFKTVVLTQPHRQADQTFIGILNNLRDGKQLDDADLDLLLDHQHDAAGGLNLFPTNVLTDSYNMMELMKLKTPLRRFPCHDDFRWNEVRHPDLYYYRAVDFAGPPGCLLSLRESIFQSELILRVGMPVMLTYNVDPDAGLINGSRGKLVSFQEYDPENLTCADSKSLNYLPAAGGEHKHYRNERVRSWIEKAPIKKWPVVKFENGVVRQIYPVCQVEAHGDAKDDDESSLLSRTQLPLLPAWAVTVHKSQGLSLDKVIVHLDKAFEREQPYVALSRAKSLSGLQVVSENRLAILRKDGKLAGLQTRDVVGDFLEKCSNKV